LIWLFAAFLVAWGNAQPPLIGATAVLPGGSWAFVVAGIGLVALALSAHTEVASMPTLSASRVRISRAAWPLVRSPDRASRC